MPFDFKCAKCCPNISMKNVLKNVQTTLGWDYKAGNQNSKETKIF